jgi:hypothetical protein
MFLEAIRPVIYHVTTVADIKFYLPSLEAQICKRAPKDKYDLKAMSTLLLD